MFNCVASQPILNTKKEVFGYELLYRASPDSAAYDGEDRNSATREVLLTAFSKTGIEEITGGKRAFVNFTPEMISLEVPHMLSSGILVVELLEDTLPTPEVVEACRQLREKGYMIALDDFVYSEEYEPLIQLATIIKIDFLKQTTEDIKRDVKKINRGHRKVLLAEKIETHDDFELARMLGFTLFQGFFFCKPVTRSFKNVDALPGSKLRLLRHISDPEVSFSDLANVIKQDMVLSYRLLKIVNSAYYGLNYSVNGILHALTILGLDKIKKWGFLILLSELKPGKPSELIRTCLIRGLYMEKLAAHMKRGKNRDEYFVVGLFSLADAVLDSPLEEILTQTHLSDEICRPLITGEGEAAELLQIAVNIEAARWDEAMVLAEKYGIGQEDASRYYVESMIDANKLLN